MVLSVDTECSLNKTTRIGSMISGTKVMDTINVRTSALGAYLFLSFFTWVLIQSGRLLGPGRLIILNEQLVEIKEKFSTLELKQKKYYIGDFQFIPFSLLLCFFKSNRNYTWAVTFITCFESGYFVFSCLV